MAVVHTMYIQTQPLHTIGIQQLQKLYMSAMSYIDLSRNYMRQQMLTKRNLGIENEEINNFNFIKWMRSDIRA
jgi:hypothetical protein